MKNLPSRMRQYAAFDHLQKTIKGHQKVVMCWNWRTCLNWGRNCLNWGETCLNWGGIASIGGDLFELGEELLESPLIS